MSDQALRQTPADLYILGAGVCFPDQLTLETIEALQVCRAVLTNLKDPQLAALPEDLRVKCTSLWPLYMEGRVRRENYRDVFQTVVDAVESERPVGWLTPGHPVFFDSVSNALIREGHARKWQVRVFAAVSSIDTILAEVEFDPGMGLCVYEATALVMEQLPIVPTVGLLLLQLSVFMNERAVLSRNAPGPDLAPLRDYLGVSYGAHHQCAFVHSPTDTWLRSSVRWVRLDELASVPFSDFGGSTLFVPPWSPSSL
jgi:hypothetical protein